MSVGQGWYAIGQENAPLTMVEFTDYQCPFCRRFESETFAQLKKNYIDTGKVRFVSRDLPLEFHPNAPRAAIAVRCAGEQHKFWEMHDAIMQDTATDLGPDAILKYAQKVSLDIPHSNPVSTKRDTSLPFRRTPQMRVCSGSAELPAS